LTLIHKEIVKIIKKNQDGSTVNGNSNSLALQQHNDGMKHRIDQHINTWSWWQFKHVEV